MDTLRFWKLCKRVKNGRQATRLWNWADGQISPELYWNLMRIRLPWFFDDIRDPNSARLEG